jgi:hypothetical protein
MATTARPPRAVRSAETRDSWRAWSAGVHGAGWEETRRRYWASRWTLARCLWCRGRRGLQLNHLTYTCSIKARGGLILWPLYAFVLVPLCPRCHRAETWITRHVFRSLTGRWGAHLLATFVPYLASRAAVLAGLSYLVGILTG